MDLREWMDRPDRPDPWSEGEKIPWDDPVFSARMLTEHLSQTHDAASRRLEIVDAHVAWIHKELLNGVPSRILDIGCGPGLYAHRLADLGHRVIGVDVSPASLAHATTAGPLTRPNGGGVGFIHADARNHRPDEPVDLVIILHGEANMFRPQELRSMLATFRECTTPDGRILLEAHSATAVRRIGTAPNYWRSRATSVFSDHPHLWLEEAWWHEEPACAVQRWSIIDASSHTLQCHAATTQAYSDDAYRTLLIEAGYAAAEIAAEQGPFNSPEYVTIVGRAHL